MSLSTPGEGSVSELLELKIIQLDPTNTLLPKKDVLISQKHVKTMDTSVVSIWT
jgi:hypothetical protein